MLLIFDLDDTLIDTTNSIIPVKLKIALDCIIQAGCPVIDYEKILKKLLFINRQSGSSKEALENFFKNRPQSEKSKYFSLACASVYSDLPAGLPVKPQKDAIKILNELAFSHTLAVVSHGEEKQQLAKLEKAGIDCRLFSIIVVTASEDKGPFYKQIFDQFKFEPRQVIVCGDRVARDLLPANKLGFFTVHMRQGRGKNMPSSPEVDYSITKLAEIKKIIQKVAHE